MFAPLIVVTGTGTGIGKTHVACAILRCSGERLERVFGYKPVESGVTLASASDAERLARVSTFHVKHDLPSLRLSASLSPHWAAELEGTRLDWSAVVAFVHTLRSDGVAVVLELPGGLFTPLSEGFRNVDALGSLKPSATLLLAPDRLGVLHDVGAATAGAAYVGATITAIGLVTPQEPDASTGGNAQRLRSLVSVPVVGVWPRATETALLDEATTAVVDLWLGNT